MLWCSSLANRSFLLRTFRQNVLSDSLLKAGASLLAHLQSAFSRSEHYLFPLVLTNTPSALA